MVGNRADSNPYGGGLFAEAGSEPVIKNTILADNYSLYSSRGPDIYGVVRSADFNLVEDGGGHTLKGSTENNITGVDPVLGGLIDNGGGTRTHALLAGSPGIDAGSCTDTSGVTIGTDQRGVERPQGSHCDIGAYEFPQPRLGLDKYVDDSSPEPGQSITYTIVVENSGAADATGGTISDTLPSGLGLVGAIILEPPSAGTTHTVPTLVTDLTVASGERVTVTLPVSVSQSLPTPTVLTNVAAVTSTEIPAPQMGSRAIIVTRDLCPRVYLPMVVRAF